MVSKFEHIPELSEEDPRFRIMDAWAAIDNVLKSEPQSLRDAYELNEQLRLIKANPNLGDDTEYQTAIQSASPELADGLKKFREVANEMKGLAITYKICIRQMGLLSITGHTDKGEERLENLWVTQQGEWWPYDGFIQRAFVGPSTDRLGGLCVGLIVINDENDDYERFLALNTIHHVRFYEPGETYVLDESPAERAARHLGIKDWKQ